MTPRLNWPPLPIPISTEWRQRCEPHVRSHAESKIDESQTAESQTAESTPTAYEKTLATLVVQYYLRIIDVPHRLETLPSGLTLYVEDLDGYLACCPLPPAAQKCSIPAHSQTQSKGYFFVELSAPYHQAQVLGFVPQVSVSELPLSYLQPLSAFVEALEKNLETAPETASKSTPSRFPRIPLADWTQGLIAGWHSPQALPPAIRPAQAMRSSIQPQDPSPLYERYAADQGDITLAKSLAALPATDALTQIMNTTTDDVIRWQAAEQLAQQDSRNGAQGAMLRVKSLVNDLGGLEIALLVGTVTKPDGTFLIGCRLYRLQGEQGEQHALPNNIVLQGVEEKSGEAGNMDGENVEQGTIKAETEAENQFFCQLTPATHGDPLEYLFTAEAGDCFSLRVYYEGNSAVNTFVL